MNFLCSSPKRMVFLSATLFSLTLGASNATPVQSGFLACNVAPGIGFIIGSSKSVSCIYHRAHGRPEYYTGTISRIGLDIGARPVLGSLPGAWSRLGLLAISPWPAITPDPEPVLL